MPTYTFNINSSKDKSSTYDGPDAEHDSDADDHSKAMNSMLPMGKKKRTAAQQAALKKMLNANKGN